MGILMLQKVVPAQDLLRRNELKLRLFGTLEDLR